MPSLEAKRLADATESLSKDATSKGTPSARFKNTVNHWGAFVLGAFLYLIQTLLMAIIGANFIFFATLPQGAAGVPGPSIHDFFPSYLTQYLEFDAPCGTLPEVDIEDMDYAHKSDSKDDDSAPPTFGLCSEAATEPIDPHKVYSEKGGAKQHEGLVQSEILAAGGWTAYYQVKSEYALAGHQIKDEIKETLVQAFKAKSVGGDSNADHISPKNFMRGLTEEYEHFLKDEQIGKIGMNPTTMKPYPLPAFKNKTIGKLVTKINAIIQRSKFTPPTDSRIEDDFVFKKMHVENVKVGAIASAASRSMAMPIMSGTPGAYSQGVRYGGVSNPGQAALGAVTAAQDAAKMKLKFEQEQEQTRKSLHHLAQRQTLILKLSTIVTDSLALSSGDDVAGAVAVLFSKELLETTNEELGAWQTCLQNWEDRCVDLCPYFVEVGQDQCKHLWGMNFDPNIPGPEMQKEAAAAQERFDGNKQDTKEKKAAKAQKKKNKKENKAKCKAQDGPTGNSKLCTDTKLLDDATCTWHEKKKTCRLTTTSDKVKAKGSAAVKSAKAAKASAAAAASSATASAKANTAKARAALNNTQAGRAATSKLRSVRERIKAHANNHPLRTGTNRLGDFIQKKLMERHERNVDAMATDNLARGGGKVVQEGGQYNRRCRKTSSSTLAKMTQGALATNLKESWPYNMWRYPLSDEYATYDASFNMKPGIAYAERPTPWGGGGWANWFTRMIAGNYAFMRSIIVMIMGVFGREDDTARTIINSDTFLMLISWIQILLAGAISPIICILSGLRCAYEGQYMLKYRKDPRSKTSINNVQPEPYMAATANGGCCLPPVGPATDPEWNLKGRSALWTWWHKVWMWFKRAFNCTLNPWASKYLPAGLFVTVLSTIGGIFFGFFFGFSILGVWQTLQYIVTFLMYPVFIAPGIIRDIIKCNAEFLAIVYGALILEVATRTLTPTTYGTMSFGWLILLIRAIWRGMRS